LIFNSYVFIFAFLPVVFAGSWLLGFGRRQGAVFIWLSLASLFFYGWWNPACVILILLSLIFNYAWIRLLTVHPAMGWRRFLLVMGIGANLFVLGYFKYANFFVNTANELTGVHLYWEPVILPLGISFLTFLQIACLVDVYRGEVKETDFIHYCLFVTFFPKLVMGPIVRHREIFPQLIRPEIIGIKAENISVGLTVFLIGLFKKTVLADNMAVYATPVFDAAESAGLINVVDAWTGALAYTFQLYFDFSGYTDMAIGVSRLFGIVLPPNFYSPYKSLNIMDFWRRWHMTLSRFLRDYLYIPLGGNRKGELRYSLNLLVTMSLCGLWHGAGWTFVLWGFCHGMIMTGNHVWRKLSDHWGFNRDHRFYKGLAWFCTFIAVVCLWVVFRARTIDGALNLLRDMMGMNGFSVDALGYHLVDSGSFYWILACFVIVLFMPNTHQLMHDHHSFPTGIKGEERSRWVWKPSLKWALIGAVMALCSFLSLSTVTEFIYFQF